MASFVLLRSVGPITEVAHVCFVRDVEHLGSLYVGTRAECEAMALRLKRRYRDTRYIVAQLVSEAQPATDVRMEEIL